MSQFISRKLLDLSLDSITSYHLKQISIIGTHITKFRLLILRQSNISSRLIPAAISLPAPKAIYDAGYDGQGCKSEADRVSGNIVWCLSGDEGEGGDDTSDVTEADLPCAANCSAVMAARRRS